MQTRHLLPHANAIFRNCFDLSNQLKNNERNIKFLRISVITTRRKILRWHRRRRRGRRRQGGQCSLS